MEMAKWYFFHAISYCVSIVSCPAITSGLFLCQGRLAVAPAGRDEMAVLEDLPA